MNVFPSFEHPWYLLGLFVPLALLVWVWWPKTQRIVLPYDHGPPGRGVLWGIFLDMASSVPGLLLMVAVVILAGPMWFGQPKEKRSLTNIELCVDVSGSMTTPWGDGNRYDAAMQAIDQFLGFRKGDAVGLTFFGNEFLHWCPLTTDVSAVKCSVPFMRPDKIPRWFNGTEIGKALKACAKRLVDREDGDKMIVLVTDGQSQDLFNGAELEVAKKLKENNIVMFAIIVGGEWAQDELYTIAQQVGGGVWEAGDPHALQEIFKRIDSMKPAKMEKSLAEAADLFWPFCLIGLACLSGFALSGLVGVRAVPW